MKHFEECTARNEHSYSSSADYSTGQFTMMVMFLEEDESLTKDAWSSLFSKFPQNI
jgi:hypothetical protein